jgi:hypothetical protein
MTKTPSLPEMIVSLRRTVAFHQEREAFHGQQEAHFAQQAKLHGEERSRHAAELASASQHLEELLRMEERLGEVVQQARAVPPETREESLGHKPNLSKAVDQVLALWPVDVPFTASSLASEVHRRYGAILHRDVDPRAVAAALRRRRNDRLVEEVRAGRPFQEALYRKVAGAK